MHQTPIEIDVASVKEMLTQKADFLLLDVRENGEYATAKIDGSTLIPMSELQMRWDELEPHRDKRIVVHCHHGGRSMRVVQVLREKGFRHAQNMAGGIDLWSEAIDASVPRY